MDINSIQIDPIAINDGQWISGLDGMGDVALKVRGMRSKMFNDARAEKYRALPRDSRGRMGVPDPDVAKQIILELLHEVVLLDWRGIVNGGKEVKYSPEQAKAWIMDPRFERFADAVTQAAGWVDIGEADEVEAVAGN